MTIKGYDEIARKLKRLSDARLARDIGNALYVGGEILATEAQLSITQGSMSGAKHIPSKPGEPPMNDSGVLAGNIETVQKSPALVEVSSNAPYSKALEYGTSKMAARPFLIPARNKTRKTIVELVAKAVNEAKRGR